MKKFLGYRIVEAMPDEGIDEALIALRDIAVFHYERAHRILPLPAEPRRHTGRIIGTSERPDLDI